MPLVCRSAACGKPKTSFDLPDLNQRVQGRCPNGMTGTHSDTKPDLRRELRARRRGIHGRMARRAAEAAARRLVRLPQWRRARYIGLYLATDGEIDTRPLIRAAWQAGKQVYLPVIQTSGRLAFRRITPTTPLITGRFGIRVPARAGEPHRPVARLDVLVIPLVGFDAAGHRLGRGGGFYDRTLAGRGRGRRPLRVGLAHACQQHSAIPHDSRDQRLDRVVTDRAIHLC